MNPEFWNSFYAGTAVPATPSAFAAYVLTHLQQGDRILELGCGNGRDSLCFAKHGYSVCAIDQVTAPTLPQHPLMTFLQQDIAAITEDTLPEYDVVYARFLFHAIPAQTTKHVLKHIKGRLFAEFRAKGDTPVLYPDHERVFWRRGDFEQLLHDAGFSVITFDMARGRAVYKEEDPLVFRLEAVK